MLVSTDFLMMGLIGVLIIVALSVTFIKDLLYVVITFGIYSLIMALLWLQLNAPDLAITEAAAGIGTTTLMIGLIRRTVRRER